MVGGGGGPTALPLLPLSLLGTPAKSSQIELKMSIWLWEASLYLRRSPFRQSRVPSFSHSICTSAAAAAAADPFSSLDGRIHVHDGGGGDNEPGCNAPPK